MICYVGNYKYHLQMNQSLIDKLSKMPAIQVDLISGVYCSLVITKKDCLKVFILNSITQILKCFQIAYNLFLRFCHSESLSLLLLVSSSHSRKICGSMRTVRDLTSQWPHSSLCAEAECSREALGTKTLERENQQKRQQP